MTKSVYDLKRTPKKWCTATSVSEVYHQGFIEGVDVAADYYKGLLEDVVNELNLSDKAFERHGPLATEPAELVRLVLEEKDTLIRALRQGFAEI